MRNRGLLLLGLIALTGALVLAAKSSAPTLKKVTDSICPGLRANGSTTSPSPPTITTCSQLTSPEGSLLDRPQRVSKSTYYCSAEPELPGPVARARGSSLNSQVEIT